MPRTAKPQFPPNRYWREQSGAPGARRAQPDGGLALDSPRGLRDVRRFAHEAMATVFEVYSAHPDEHYAAQAAHAVFDLVDRLEGELSRFLPNSDISRVNALAAGAGTQVSPSTFECLAIARHVHQLTDGAFDISIGTGLDTLELDADHFTVRATRAGVRLDLGGIGKGYAIDRMAEALAEWDLGPALVHGGFSSILALDPPAGEEGWPLTMTDPGATDRIVVRLSARQAALSASGTRKGDHIVHPRTGKAVRGRRGAWVLVPRVEASPGAGGETAVAAGTVADALTTAFMLMPRRDVEALCRRTPGLEAWLLEEPPRRSGGEALLRHYGGPAGAE